MKRRHWLLAACLLVAVTGGAIGFVAWWRLRELRAYLRPHAVQRGGTNYFFQLQETTLGRSGSNCLLLLHVRLRNPNPFAVRLARREFSLMDDDKDFVTPTVDGTQGAWIELPAGGIVERETLSYRVRPDAFKGTLAVYAGQYHFVLVKEKQPYQLTLRDGEFVSFRRREW
jgi:hypothetical protein